MSDMTKRWRARAARWVVAIAVAIGAAGTAGAVAEPICTVHRFKSGEELTHSRVGWFVQDDAGIIWLGMWNGLCRYDGRQFLLFRSAPDNDNPQSINRIIYMEVDSRQNLWCVTSNALLYLFDRKTSTFADVFAATGETGRVERSRRSVFSLRAKGVTWVVLSDGTCLRFTDGAATAPERLFAPVGGARRTAAARQVYDIYLDSRGREWILASDGVYLYGGRTVTNYPFMDIHELCGRVFLVSADGYFAEGGDGDALRFLDFPAEVKHIYCSQEVGDGVLAIGTDAGLIFYDAATGQFSLHDRAADGTRIPSVDHIYRDGRGRTWIFVRGDDVYCLKAGRDRLQRFASPVRVREANEREGLHLIFEDADGVVWVKPERGPLAWYDEEADRLRSYAEVLKDGGGGGDLVGEYSGYYVDSQRNLWLFSGPELYRMTFCGRQFAHRSSDGTGEVRSLCNADSTRLWQGTRTGHLSCRRPDGTLRYLTPSGQFTAAPVPFSDKGIYCIERDSRGDYWVGTRGDGLYRLRAASGERWAVEHFRAGTGVFSLSNDNIYALYEDEYRHLWVATYGGGINLVSLNGETVRFINKNNKLQNYPADGYTLVRCVTGTRHGAVMVGTTEGMLTFTSQFSRPAEILFHRQEKRHGDAESLPGNDIMQIVHSAATGRTFVCAYGLGVSELLSENLLADSLRFRTHLNHGHPACDVVVSAGEDTSGRLWTVAESGVGCFHPATSEWVYFDQTDFDRDYRFTEARPVLFPSGEMCFGTADGVLSFNADSLGKDHYCPPLVFTSVQYPGDLRAYPVNDMDTLALPSCRRSVSISFAALDYRPSRLLRYAYRLDGVDEAWTYTDNPVVNYVNLPAGDYRLLVRSTNHDGQWCDNGRTLTLTVAPTLWETPWAWLLYALCAAAVVLLILYIYRYIYNLRHRMDVERQMASEKLRFFTDMSHELRTPLTLVSVPIDKVLADEPLSPQARSHLEVASSNAARMLELVNRLLGIRKEEAVRLPVATALPTLAAPQVVDYDKEFVRRVMEYFERNMSRADLAVDDFADALHMSRTTFYRKMRAVVGLSPVDFIRQIRIRRAVQYINGGEESLSQIAYKVGFSDPKYFSKCFKHEMGMPPLEYKHRAAAARREAAASGDKE